MSGRCHLFVISGQFISGLASDGTIRSLPQAVLWEEAEAKARGRARAIRMEGLMRRLAR
jgi:hypothetical protein